MTKMMFCAITTNNNKQNDHSKDFIETSDHTNLDANIFVIAYLKDDQKYFQHFQNNGFKSLKTNYPNHDFIIINHTHRDGEVDNKTIKDFARENDIIFYEKNDTASINREQIIKIAHENRKIPKLKKNGHILEFVFTTALFLASAISSIITSLFTYLSLTFINNDFIKNLLIGIGATPTIALLPYTALQCCGFTVLKLKDVKENNKLLKEDRLSTSEVLFSFTDKLLITRNCPQDEKQQII
jgi:hypothetical protein